MQGDILKVIRDYVPVLIKQDQNRVKEKPVPVGGLISSSPLKGLGAMRTLVTVMGVKQNGLIENLEITNLNGKDFVTVSGPLIMDTL